MTFAKDKPLIGVNVKRTATKQTEDGEGWGGVEKHVKKRAGTRN
jgi:hypothetical protein